MQDGVGLEELRVSLVEGLGPGVEKRFDARRSRERLVSMHQRDLWDRLSSLREGDPGRDFLAARLFSYEREISFLRALDLDSLLSDATFEELDGARVSVERRSSPATQVTKEGWDSLLGPEDSFFLEHGFLAGLEATGCVSLELGWQPRFLIVQAGASGSADRGRIVGAVPLYLKMHSDGEFCEDSEWIEASRRCRISHWPRLFVGVPFTPHTGRRLLSAVWLGSKERARVQGVLVRALRALSERVQMSVNVAFGTDEDAAFFQSSGFVERRARQCWWTNRQPEPYRDFEDFLCALRVKNAKNILKQRKLAQENLSVEVIDGSLDAAAVTTELMAEVYHTCYKPTQLRHGNILPFNDSGDDYRCELNERFFRHLAEHCPHRVVLVLARSPAGELLGGALCFTKGRRICGRYWGYRLSEHPTPFLHFECCYHMLIDHAIRHGYARVEPGNGGGTIYRVQRDRGFEPVLTPSQHFIPNPELREEVTRVAAAAAAEEPSWTAQRRSAYAPLPRGQT